MDPRVELALLKLELNANYGRVPELELARTANIYARMGELRKEIRDEKRI